MGVMTDQLVFAPGRPLTVADLEAMPDDGRRYELIDGLLIVSPSPNRWHQRMGLQLAVLLVEGCPPHCEVLMAPFDVQTSEENVVQPDVIVALMEDLTDKNLPVAPLLAVEVLSPSSRLYDRNTKMAHYARIGVASYWLLDPTGPGTVEVHELDSDGAYRIVASATGDEEITLDRPFPVTVCPAALLAGRPAQAG